MQQVEEKFEALKSQIDRMQTRAAENKLAMVVFSGDLDKPVLRV